MVTATHATLTDEEVLAQHNHAEMIRRSHLWPLAVILPLTRGPITNPIDAPPTRFGIVLRGHPTRVYVGVWYLGPPLAVLQYNSPEAIVADGWLVD